MRAIHAVALAVLWACNSGTETRVDLQKVKSSEELIKIGHMKPPKKEPAPPPPEAPPTFSKEDIERMSPEGRMKLLRAECRADGRCPANLMFVLDDVVTDRKERTAIHKACVAQRKMAVARLAALQLQMSNLSARFARMDAVDELSDVCQARQSLFLRLLREIRSELHSEDVATAASFELKHAWSELHSCIFRCSAGCSEASGPLRQAARELKENQAEYCPTIEREAP